MSAEPELEVVLIAGESVDLGVPPSVTEVDDATLNRRYVESGVRIVIEQARYPLSQIPTMFSDTYRTEDGHEEVKYKRDPEYQRRHRWSAERQSRLIESFLMNVPVPPVFLYEYDLARFEVMDGRQRLTAVMDFYQGRLVLEGMQYWPELDGRTYATLPSSIRDGIDRRYLSSIILLNETAASPDQAASLKKMVFERLNSGGVELSGQETRNAVFDGPLNDLCLELSKLDSLRKVLGIPLNIDDESQESTASTPGPLKMYASMDDVEMVLRFFAYRHISEFRQGLNRISEFLDEFLVAGNGFPADVLAEYREMFTRNVGFWFDVGGAEVFKVPGNNRHFSRIAFDALMYASSALTDEEVESLRTRSEAVMSAVIELYKGGLFEGRKTNSSTVRDRNAATLLTLAGLLAEGSG